MKTVIIPDVHGRTFWKEAAERFPGERFIFLGDYLDPYDLEAVHFNITPESTIENFREIIAFKKRNPDRVTLLLGNHDCEYMYGKDVCNCRCDHRNYFLIQELFRENKDLFVLAAEAFLGGKHFVFSHAGIQIGWMEKHIKGWNIGNLVQKFNDSNRQALAVDHPECTSFAMALSEADKERSGESDCGSPVWADAEMMNEGYQLSEIVQVVGHSCMRFNTPAITPNVIYTDCGRAFYLSERGTLYDLGGKRCKNEHGDPFRPDPDKYERDALFDFDAFQRPFCRSCGSHNIYIRSGMMADHWYCQDCHKDQIL